MDQRQNRNIRIFCAILAVLALGWCGIELMMVMYNGDRLESRISYGIGVALLAICGLIAASGRALGNSPKH